MYRIVFTEEAKKGSEIITQESSASYKETKVIVSRVAATSSNRNRTDRTVEILY